MVVFIPKKNMVVLFEYIYVRNELIKITFLTQKLQILTSNI
jgi:hypothetical protein